MSISLALTTAGAIPDLDTLKSSVADWLDRDDLTSRLPTFISLVESICNRELRTPEMESTVTFTAINEDTPFPVNNFLAMRSIYVEGSPDRPLKAMAPNALRQEFNGVVGVPTAYSIVSNAIRLAPPPNDDTLLTMDYFASIDPLSVETPSNWLLEKHPGVYLFGTLYFAEAFLDNVTRAGQWKGLFDEALGRVVKTSRNNRWGSGPLVPNLAIQVRGSAC